MNLSATESNMEAFLPEITGLEVEYQKICFEYFPIFKPKFPLELYEGVFLFRP